MQAKSFVRIDAKPGRPAQITRVPYRGGRELVVVRATLEELEARRVALSAAGWLKVIAQLAVPDPEFGRKVHALLDNVTAIDFECPAMETASEPGPTLRDASPVQVYRAWFEREHGRAMEPAVEQAFHTLLSEEGES